MIRISNIKFLNDGKTVISNEKLLDNLKNKSARLLKLDKEGIEKIEIIKHSIDARKKPEIYDLYTIDVGIKASAKEEKIIKKSGCKNAVIHKEKKYRFPLRRSEDEDKKENTNGKADRPIIIGAGPAGLFCAYMLADAGYRPIILERGLDVDQRQKAVEDFWNGNELNLKTNVQFGEGGAGTFSDGKLNTMVKDKDGRGHKCLEIFVENGARKDILYEAKPHIGTDVLRRVVKNMRKHISELGGEYFFDSKVTELLTNDNDSKRKICGVRCEDGREFYSGIVVLAIGHSARDTFAMLHNYGIKMEPKPFAVGLRAEHRQSLINQSQYGIAEPVSLPPSPYKVTAQSDSGHGVYSFCMCPGGYVVNASSEENRLTVNGMSYSGREGRNANSAIIVTVDPKDFGSEDVLSGVEFQRKLEENAYRIGKGKIPVEYFDDFCDGVLRIKNKQAQDDLLQRINEHAESGRNLPCMKGEYNFAPVHEILPPELSETIVFGMHRFGQMIKGFDDEDVLLSGVEARTSSPVRINRDLRLESDSISGLYPCGEGAGYAGGITSAAMDGMKVAEQIAIRFYSGKDIIRRNMKKLRSNISDASRKDMDASIFKQIINSEEYKSAENILVYCNMPDEADTTELISNALMSKNVYCPRVTDTHKHTMEFIRIQSMDELKKSSYGIMEPDLNTSSVLFKEAKKKTLMIIPGLCFDRSGNRIGYGGGFYDCFLKRFCKEIQNGMIKSMSPAYHFQISDEGLDAYVSSHDIPVNMIVTDKECIRV